MSSNATITTTTIKTPTHTPALNMPPIASQDVSDAIHTESNRNVFSLIIKDF